MTVKSVRIEMDYAGVGELLGSPEVQRDLEDRCAAIKAAADNRHVKVGSDTSGEEIDVPITVVPAGSKRARCLVSIDHPSGLAVESKYRLLGGSLEAGK